MKPTKVECVDRCREGAILGMMLIMVAAISLIGWGLLQLSALNGVEVSRNANRDRAFWAAEAGVSHVRAKLGTDSSYRLFPATLYGWVLPYTAVVTVDGGGNYTITSTGSVFGTDRVVRQGVTVELSGWPSAFDYALFGGGGTMDIGKDATVVTGSLYQVGNVNIGMNPTITNGYVYATGTVSGFPQTPPPDPAPTMPGFDETFYTNLINTAAASTNITLPTNLAGKTNYVRGAQTINSSITGPGVLVVSGGVNINKASPFGDNITLVTGGQLMFSKDCGMGTNCLIYAQAGFDVAKDNTVIGNCVLLTPAAVDIKKSFSFTGVLFAEGTVTLEKDAVIAGTIVAGGGFDIRKTLMLTYDPTQISGLPPPGIETQINVNNLQWSELFP